MANGLPIYVEPSGAFAPARLHAVYTWLGGLLLAVTGPSLAPLRLLSLAATLVSAGLITWIGRRERHLADRAVAGGALYLAGYRIVGGWYDLARVGALFMALTWPAWRL